MGPKSTQENFHERIQYYKTQNFPVWKHHFWWFVHNCITHPLIGIYPTTRTFSFHDFTSKKINGVGVEPNA